MKPRALLRLIVSLLIILGFVVGATMLESNGSQNTTAWYWAQRELPLLWVIDGFAVLTLLPVLGFATLQNRLARRSEESAEGRDEHQNQMEAMIHNAEQTERLSTEQAEQIAALQETVAGLSARLTDVQTEATARQHALEAEAHRLAEQAFAALVGQVEANTRQMEAVSLAMQYQRAEIKQLRQGMRAMQYPQDIIDVAHLTLADLPALRGENAPRLLEAEQREIIETEIIERETEEKETKKEQTDLNTGAIGFFEPTMNAETTFIAPMMAYEISPSFEAMVASTKTKTNDVSAEFSSDFSPEVALSETRLPGVEITQHVPVTQTPDGAVTAEEARHLPDQIPAQTTDSAPEPTTLLADETEQIPPPKPGRRRWLSRS